MIDSHAHLDMDAFDSDRDRVIDRAAGAGVSSILSLGLIDEKDSYEKAFPLVDRHHLYTAVGCHPHDAKIFDERGGEGLVKRLSDRPRLLAIGEIGLDYHYNLSPPDVQRDVFRRQIRVARELGLPIIVHHRDAARDLVEILDEEDVGEVGGILHSFTADLATAEAAIRLGLLISFSGILTFKNAEPLREVAKALPLEKLLVETDCPYLAPVPHRGKRNEPALVVETLDCLARLRGERPEVVDAATDENFLDLFDLR
ncbi:MAG TPA: TatD family hydrolase [Vicinamibacteria bacterium]|nr:TatD family hydrolase [Vicinamibacteria bacterium]